MKTKTIILISTAILLITACVTGAILVNKDKDKDVDVTIPETTTIEETEETSVAETEEISILETEEEIILETEEETSQETEEETSQETEEETTILETEEETTFIETEPIPEYTVTPMNGIMYTSSYVNVRKGPATTYDKVGSFNKGTEITITGRASTGWYEIDFEGNKAYLSDTLVQDTKPSQEQEKPPVKENKEPEPVFETDKYGCYTEKGLIDMCEYYGLSMGAESDPDLYNGEHFD